MRRGLKCALFGVAAGLLLSFSVIDWSGAPVESPQARGREVPPDCVTSNCLLLRAQKNPTAFPHLANADVSVLFSRSWH